VGNRTAASSSESGLIPVSGTFNADDELSAETYDQNGNVAATGGKSFVYDSENHLVSMGSTVLLVYDGDGNRVAKTVNGVRTRYLVDDLNPTGYPQVVDELNGAGTVTRTYTYGPQRNSEYQSISGTWTASFYGYDGGGNVRTLTNAAGSITDTYEYDAFGNGVSTSGSTPNNYLYRGEQYDFDLGLYYLRARYYNPLTGRFMSRDPRDGQFINGTRIPNDPRKLHKYLYAEGDPANLLDRSGLDAEISYALRLNATFKLTTFLNSVSCEISVGTSLATGGLVEAFGDDPTGTTLTAFGCITMDVDAGKLTLGFDTVGLARCAWSFFQTYEDERVRRAARSRTPTNMTPSAMASQRVDRRPTTTSTAANSTSPTSAYYLRAAPNRKVLKSSTRADH
jgi:RHS repeat-associated protein